MKTLWFTLLFGFQGTAQASLPEQHPMSREEWSAKDLPSEDEVSANYKLTGREKALTYVNPRTTNDACGTPLTLEEKLEQQNLKSYPEQMRAQGVREAALKILGIEILNPVNRGLKDMVFDHPWTVAHFSKLKEIRDRAWKMEKFRFDPSVFDRVDDEADAFRHFIVAGFLLMEYGEETTRALLLSHEDYQRDLGTLMDLYNNEVALRFFLSDLNGWKKKSELGLSNAMYENFLNLLQNGKLIVLKRKLETTPAPSPDFYRWGHQLLRNKLK